MLAQAANLNEEQFSRNLLKELTRYATRFRYPGESAIDKDAQTAISIMRHFRNRIRIELNLPPETKSIKD